MFGSLIGDFTQPPPSLPQPFALLPLALLPLAAALLVATTPLPNSLAALVPARADSTAGLNKLKQRDMLLPA